MKRLAMFILTTLVMLGLAPSSPALEVLRWERRYLGASRSWERSRSPSQSLSRLAP